MEKKIIFAFILGAIISSLVGVIAANTISSSSVLYKNDKTVNTVLDELFENVDAIESNDTRLTSLEGKVNTLTSTHSSDITTIDNNITSINSKIGSSDISSLGSNITNAINSLNSKTNQLSSVDLLASVDSNSSTNQTISVPITTVNWTSLYSMLIVSVGYSWGWKAYQVILPAGGVISMPLTRDGNYHTALRIEVGPTSLNFINYDVSLYTHEGDKIDVYGVIKK